MGYRLRDPRSCISAIRAPLNFIGTTSEDNEPESPDDLGANVIARRSFAEDRFLWVTELDEAAGDLLPMPGGVLALHGHPRLYDAQDGNLLAEWPISRVGARTAQSSGTKHSAAQPASQSTSAQPRFAVTDGQRVTVIRLE